MSKIKINNHRNAPLVLRTSDGGSKSILYVSKGGKDKPFAEIPPLSSGMVDKDLWDKVKNNAVYVNWLDRGIISTGDGDEPNKGTMKPFTSFGDTLERPVNLTNESLERDAGMKEKIISGGTPVTDTETLTSMGELQQKRRGRPSNAEIAARAASQQAVGV